MLDGVLRKREYAWLSGLFGGEGSAFLACGNVAGVFSVLFTVDPLEQDVEQKVKAKNAERQEYRKRHGNLTRADVSRQPRQGKGRRGKAKKS